MNHVKLPKTNWDISQIKLEIHPLVKQYERFLKNQGYREATIRGYCNPIRVYLRFVKGNPTAEQALKFRETLIGSNLKPIFSK